MPIEAGRIHRSPRCGQRACSPLRFPAQIDLDPLFATAQALPCAGEADRRSDRRDRLRRRAWSAGRSKYWQKPTPAEPYSSMHGRPPTQHLSSRCSDSEDLGVEWDSELKFRPPAQSRTRCRFGPRTLAKSPHQPCPDRAFEPPNATTWKSRASQARAPRSSGKGERDRMPSRPLPFPSTRWARPRAVRRGRSGVSSPGGISRVAPESSVPIALSSRAANVTRGPAILAGRRTVSSTGTAIPTPANR